MAVISTVPTTKSTPSLGLPLVLPANGDISGLCYVLDALLHGGPKSASITTPVPGPTQGDVYIVPTGATGAWAGQAGSLAVCNPSSINSGQPSRYTFEWNFIVPKVGMNLYVQDVGKFYVYSGSTWIPSPLAFAAVPATSSAAGVAGQISADANFLYICIAANSWRKVATATF